MALSRLNAFSSSLVYSPSLFSDMLSSRARFLPVDLLAELLALVDLSFTAALEAGAGFAGSILPLERKLRVFREDILVVQEQAWVAVSWARREAEHRIRRTCVSDLENERVHHMCLTQRKGLARRL